MASSAWIFLDDDEFCDCNYSLIFNPSLKTGPDETYLYRLAIEGREASDRAGTAWLELADVMHWTLRRASFDCFQQTHGPRPIEYHDWFYSKLHQFLSILLHDKISVWGLGQEPQTKEPWNEGELSGQGPTLNMDELEQAFTPDNDDHIPWYSLVQQVSECSNDRRVALREWLAGNRPMEKNGRMSARRTLRDQLIRDAVLLGSARREVCALLDRSGLATTPKMQRAGVHRWIDAWDDPEFKSNVQCIFSKAKERTVSSPRQFPRDFHLAIRGTTPSAR